MDRLTIILFLLLGATSGCSFFGENKDVFKSSDYKKEETVSLGVAKAPPGLDWTRNDDFASNILNVNLMEGLTNLEVRGGRVEIEPGLAKKWEESDGGLKYTFHLRENVKWTDGSYFKAQDVVDGFKRALAPETPASACEFLFAIRNARMNHDGKLGSFSEVGVHALDDHTVVFNLAEPLAYFPAILSSPVTYPIRGDLKSKPTENATLGPYKLSRYQKDRFALLTINPSYYGSKSHIKNIILRFGLSNQDHLKLYNTGELDLLGDIPSSELKRFKDKAEVLRASTLDMVFLAFDVTQRPFSNPILRRGVAMAIDRQDSVRAVGGGQEIGGAIPPRLIGYESNRGVRFDPEAAKTLLKNSGYRNMEKLKAIKLKVGSEFMTLGENILEQLKKNLEVDIELVKEESPFWTSKKSDGPVIYVSHWKANIPDPDNFMNLFKANSKNNLTKWKNRNFDEFTRNAVKQSTPEQRERLYAKAQHILTEEEMPVVPLFMREQNFVVNSRVKDLHLNILNHVLFKEAKLE